MSIEVRDNTYMTSLPDDTFANHSWLFDTTSSGLTFVIARTTIETVLTLFGNVLVIFAIWSNKKLKTIENTYIISLCVAFILTALLILPPYFFFEEYPQAEVICKIYFPFKIFFFLIPVVAIHLCVILLDRYLAMGSAKSSYGHRSKLAVICVTVSTWLLGIAVTVVSFLVYLPKEIPEFKHRDDLEYCKNVIKDLDNAFYINEPFNLLVAIYMIIMISLILVAYLKDDTAAFVQSETYNETSWSKRLNDREMVEAVLTICAVWFVEQVCRILYLFSEFDSFVRIFVNFGTSMHLVGLVAPVVCYCINREFRVALRCCSKC